MNTFTFIDFEQDLNKLRARLRDVEGGTIVIDFLRYSAIPPTEDDLNKGIIGHFKEYDVSPIIFINFGKAGKGILSTETRLKRELEKRGLIVPVFDQYSEFLYFFGLEDKHAAAIFESVLYGQALNIADLDGIDDISLRDTVSETLMANEWLFRHSTEGESSWECVLSPQEIFNSEIKREINRVGARRTITGKHFKLPSGNLTKEFIQVNLILKDAEFPQRLARGLFSKAVKDEIDFDTISTFSLNGRILSGLLQQEIKQRFDKKVDMVCLENYNHLSFPSTFTDRLPDRKVFIVLDVNNTGGLLERMASFWKENNGEVVRIGVAIDLGNYEGQYKDVNFHCLCTLGINIIEEGNYRIADADIWHIDEDTLTPMPPRTPEYTVDSIEELMEKYPEVGEFWKSIAKLGALSWHTSRNSKYYKDRHYLAFIDTAGLSSSGAERIIEYYAASGFPFDLLVCPDNQNAVMMAKEIQQIAQRKFGFYVDMIVPGRRRNSFYLSEDDKAMIRQSDGVLILDDGANTGNMLTGLSLLAGLEQKLEEEKVKACVLIDRLVGDPAKRIIRLFSENFYGVYKVSIPPYVENERECPICREMEDLDRDTKRSESPLIKSYCFERRNEIGQKDMSGTLRGTAKLEKQVSLNGFKLPYLYLRTYLLDLIGRSGEQTILIHVIRDIRDSDIVRAAIEATGMSGISRQTWSRHIDTLLDLANQIDSYEVKKTLYRTLILAEIRVDDYMLNSIVDFIAENATRQEEISFLAWLAYRVRNAQLRNLLTTKRDMSSGLAQRNVARILNALSPPDIIAESPQMIDTLELVEKVATSDATILITGESGTGKELIARRIHRHSGRAKRPFIPVHYGGLSETLLESELFGHEKGSFTGAVSQTKGKFEQADNGTIFLDEVSDMSGKLQVDLLRVLQEQEFQRVGGEETIKIDVRVLAATNKSLNELVEEGAFREDLYHRLNVIEIEVPPLRERDGDIRLLAKEFLEDQNIKNGKQIRDIDEEALRCLESYHWPGNVRELENVITRAVVLAEGDIIIKDDFPVRIFSPSRDSKKPETKAGETLNRKQRQANALDWLKHNGREIKNSIYREINKVSSATAAKELKDMATQGLVKQSGRGSSFSYYLPK